MTGMGYIGATHQLGNTRFNFRSLRVAPKAFHPRFDRANVSVKLDFEVDHMSVLTSRPGKMIGRLYVSSQKCEIKGRAHYELVVNALGEPSRDSKLSDHWTLNVDDPIEVQVGRLACIQFEEPRGDQDPDVLLRSNLGEGGVLAAF